MQTLEQAKQIGYKPQKTQPSKSSEWYEAIADFVTQCFETYPQYGNDAGSLKTQIKAFTVGLEDYNLPEISYAFRHWLKENTKMPLPADIGYVAKDHLKYLREQSKPAIQARPAPKKLAPPILPWIGKDWGKLTEADKQALYAHIDSLVQKDKERGLGYMKYLQSVCNYPDLRSRIVVEGSCTA